MTTTTVSTATRTEQAIANLSDNGTRFLTLLGRQISGADTRCMSFFDDGLAAGSGHWGEPFAQEMCGLMDASRRSMGGIMARLSNLGIFNLSPQEEYGDGPWWSLTELGVSVIESLLGEVSTGAGSVKAQPAADQPTASPEPASDEAKPLSRKQCLELLEQFNYDGPTSYLMPRLRALVAEHAR